MHKESAAAAAVAARKKQITNGGRNFITKNVKPKLGLLPRDEIIENYLLHLIHAEIVRLCLEPP